MKTKTNKKLDASTVFLVSGGAKGITAQCVIKLAQHYSCAFILVGRSAMVEQEPAWARACTAETELKKCAMEHLISQGERPKPIQVQKLVKAILSQREIKATLQAIEQAGGRAAYFSADVTDGPDLQKKLAEAVHRFGPINGIIHGAGTLADKLIEKKTAQDFKAVYAPKVKGLENLLQCVPPSQLDYLVIFSSVAAFYGNVGQSDYAIANEVLNKMAYQLKRDNPACHIVSINWGPWEAGMVTPALKELFAQRGVEVIPIEVGVQMLVDELATNNPATQVIIGSPLLPCARELEPELCTFRTRRKLSLPANPFLQDHVIGGQAVLPTVCAIGWMANTCEQFYPGYQFFACEDYRALKGIVFDDNLASDYNLDLEEVAKNDLGEIVFKALIWSKTPEDKTRYHYSAQLKLLRQIPTAPTYTGLLSPDPALSETPLYQGMPLFHGPCFRGVRRVLNITPQKLTLECALPTITPETQGQFPVQGFNHYMADVQFQSLLIWVWRFYQAASLPLRALKGEQFRAITFDEPFYVSMEVKSDTDTSLVADIIAHDAQGQVYTRVLGAEVTISKQLNELFQQNRLRGS